MTIPSGFYQATVRFDIGTSYPNGAAITFGGAVGAILNTPELVAAEINAALDAAAFTGRMSDTTGYDSILVKFGPDETGPSVLIGKTGVGEIAEQTEPPQIAVLVQKNTNLGGRRGKGRFFWPGIPETDVDTGGVMRSGVAASWQEMFDTFLDDLSSNDVAMHVLHDPSTHWVLVDGQPRRVPNVGSVPPAPTPVTSLTVKSVVATQRRRANRPS
jgi:hypothetical protein